MKATVLTIQFESTSTTLATVEGILKAMNIGYGRKDYEWEEAPVVEKKAEKKSAPKTKAETKKTSTKKAETKPETKPEPKKAESSDDFDTELYKALVARYGLGRKNGSCINFAKKAIYDAMNYASIIKTGKNAGKVKIAKKVEKTILAELVTLAAENGEAWAMDKALKAAEMVAM